MTYFIPQHSEQQLGGCWTFIKNLEKGLARYHGHKRVATWQEADIVLVAGATLASVDEVTDAKSGGKPIIFRVDNIPKDSRNRGTAISRLKALSKLSDVVVYQSEWAKHYATPLCGTGMVIYNGVDDTIFKIMEPIESRPLRFMFVQFNRDENKRFPEAAYNFHLFSREHPDAELWLVGRYSPEVQQYDFDFWNKEHVEFLSIVEDPNELAKLMNDCRFLYFPAYMDASPNTVLEARACGLEVLLTNETGGTRELLKPELDISLERMSQEYHSLFTLLLNDVREDLQPG